MALDLVKLRDCFPFGPFPADTLKIAMDDAAWSLPSHRDPLGVTCRWEILEHWGQYALARRWLDEHAPWDLVRAAIFEGLPASGRDGDWKLWVSVALGHATVSYREEDYSSAEGVLAQLQQAIDRKLEAIEDPVKRNDSLLGTRARFAFLQSQVARQQHKHETAERSLGETIALATRRFVVKTPRSEMHTVVDGPPIVRPPDFERRRALADWTIGKALALGLGWISFTRGRLTEANSLISAGYALLRGTNDGLHRAFATLLLGACERAAARDAQALRFAVEKLEDGAQGLSKHPVYRVRASYELALALYASDDPAVRGRAERQIESVTQALDPSDHRQGIRSKRWLSAALVLRSRIERRKGSPASLDDAIRIAERAFVVLGGTPHAELKAEARIALGEALLEKAASARAGQAMLIRRAVTSLHEASALGAANPKVRAVAQLHLAVAHLRQDARAEALAAFGAWDTGGLRNQVEHGRVQLLAESVEKELKQGEMFIRDDNQLESPWHNHVAALTAFLIRRATKKGWTDDRIAGHLGIEKASLSRLKRRLANQDLDAALRKVGRPKG